ncbi:histone-lysine N-methyltransferase, H3 lysine-9 specific SUVH5-like [Lotus japonicus]|uniref:histone-lysine N-methyltransferase, H3 lysine-9 specific SUVH5-like n=1 Tax=Lotus japonicus TaxID=34305 RepID=UPI00258FBD68|nr:histone-lysine N-methyltransferase, H3 lysine-9 specific SUVH5-like [Lotus japonicus]
MAPPFGRKHGKKSSSSMVSQNTLTLIASSEKKKNHVSLQHNNVRKTLGAFRELSSRLFNRSIAKNPGEQSAQIKALWGARQTMKDEEKCENTPKQVGPIEGIQVGDKFNYRAEILVIGLHRQPNRGIDYVQDINRNNSFLATSIVVTNRRANMFHNGSLVYIGEGGNPGVRTNGSSHDQKLERGNLALRNSMDARSPVRVILKVSRSSDNESATQFLFVYDGLYFVNGFTRTRGDNGKLVFKFTLNRMSGQPPTCVAHADLGFKGSYASSSRNNKRSKGSSAAQKEKTRRNDVSEGKENIAIPLMATSDCLELPPPFDYIVNVVYPGSLNLTQQPNPKDSRVQFKLAIFKTEKKGWGVRTRSFIPMGSFVCQFVGEAHLNGKDGLRLGTHDYILDIGTDKGYIDATRSGNVARFINHSCTPNLCLNDEGDKSFPHMMMYAVRNIPAGRELTYNYNFYNSRLNKADIIKCYCSSQECKGQIYV